MNNNDNRNDYDWLLNMLQGVQKVDDAKPGEEKDNAFKNWLETFFTNAQNSDDEDDDDDE